MKKVLPCLLAAAALALLAACSGTPADEPTTRPEGEAAESSAGAAETPAREALEPVAQDPQAQDIGTQRRQFLIRRSLEEANRALELRLWTDAARIAGEVLELDPANEDARRILVDAQSALGVGGVQAEFEDRIRQSQVALQKTLLDVRREMTLGDAEVEQRHYGDAIQHYERGLLLLQYSPYRPPTGDLENLLQAKLEAARQERVQAEQADEEARVAASRAELAAQEQELRIQRATRVKRLLEEANVNFQMGEYDRAVRALDQALVEEPNNAQAIELRELAGRARHENRLDVIRNVWKSEWSKTFDELNALDVPQTDPIVIDDMERWRNVVLARGPKVLGPAEDLESPEERAIQAKLETTKLEHRFSTATIEEWADYYAKVTDITFVVTPAAKELEEDKTTLTEFSLPVMSVAQALDVIGNVTGVRWKIEHGVVKLVTPEQAGGKMYLRQYEVRDIVQGVRSQPGPELKLKAPGDDDVGLPEEGDDPQPTVVDPGKLVELITTYVEPTFWEGEGASPPTETRGVLQVRATREVHEKVEKLLADLRQAVGIQVDVETRFLEVEDSFLEDIGVDFRGLGDQSSEGIPGRGLENRGNTGFDDYGPRAQTNPATPGEIGTGTEPGIFYDDGQDGDLMARTENLFDSTLGGPGAPLSNAGGLALQWTYLDDAELEIVLRAVSKEERSQIVTAPRLLIYNNTRASMQVLRQTSYIRDFDVEIAQAAAVANPIVDVVKDGVVLDVRPVVSADRRFITMELRPTVMNLELPIPTFTTTLGVGQPVQIQLPSVTLQRVRTTVTMPDGGTLMLGGMKLAQKQNQVSGIPLLQDIPLLSFFFSRKGSFVLNRKILILIRATIVIPQEHVPMLPEDLAAQTALSGR